MQFTVCPLVYRLFYHKLDKKRDELKKNDKKFLQFIEYYKKQNFCVRNKRIFKNIH